MGYNSGQVSATITLSAASKKTLSYSSVKRDNTGTVAVGTVPAGKVWRIVSASVSCASNSATVGYCQLRIAANVILNCSAISVAGGAGCGTSVSQNCTYENAIVATAGQAIDLNIVSIGAGTIWYYEEDA